MGDRTFLSYGGGTQTAALALMVAAGQLPRVDAVIMADTQGELPETYEFAEYVKDKLAAIEIPFVVVTRGNLEEALLSPVGHSGANPMPPLKTLSPDGKKGRVNVYRCSYDYKRRIVTREEKRRCGPPGAWKRMNVVQWIGYSVDEDHRVKQDTECRCGHPLDQHVNPEKLAGHAERCTCAGFDRWRVNVHPLIEMGFRRRDTIRWFAENGHPTPPRSACWFCPNSTNARWRHLLATHPDLFERACVIDEAVRFQPAFTGSSRDTMNNELFLHDTCTPLRTADLRDAETVLAEDFGVVPMFAYDCLGDSCDT